MDASQLGQVAEGEERRSGRRWMAVGVAALAVGAGAATLLFLPRDADVRVEPQLQAERTAPPAVDEGAGADDRQSGTSAAARARAPALGNSDGFMRDALTSLTEGAAAARAWVSGGDTARRAAAVLMGLVEGEVPRSLLSAFAPAGDFEVEDRDGGLRVKPSSYARYDGIAAWVGGLDAERLGEVYRTVEPVLEQAWREVAPPRLTLRDAAGKATAHLLSAPLPPEDVELVEKGAVYAFADPSLESLSPAQKQLLRMGPQNARIVQAKLREVRAALGLPVGLR